MSDKAILFGPFVGELYWEAGRFAPMLPFYKFKKYKDENIKFVVLTREERFDLYGALADILVPLRIPGDYDIHQPNCFKLNGLKAFNYKDIAKQFKKKYKQRFQVIEHLYPDVTKPAFTNKNQFSRSKMLFEFRPRSMNYDLVNNYLENVTKPLVILAPRYRNGFKRNWGNWQEFYDILWKDNEIRGDFDFIICGKKGEYVPDKRDRFYDMNKIQLVENTSLIGLLLTILERSYFTFGSQSAIPNLSLLYNVDVLEFGCQKTLHTKTYNVKNTPITFIENKKYNIGAREIFSELKKRLYLKLRSEK